MIVYVLHSLAWSLAGFVIGWSLGRLGHDVQQTREAVMPNHTRARTRPRPRPRVHIEHVIGAVVVALAVITMLTAIHTTRELQNATRCQQHFNDVYRAALVERSESTANVRRAQTDMATALSAPGAELDNAPVRDALARYLDAIRRDEQSRSANPVPDNNACPR